MSRFYFAFGSNMKRERLEDRLDEVIDHNIASLVGYRLSFNKQSVDGTGKTNIMPSEQHEVLGVLYKLSEEQLKKLDEFEKGYVRIPITVDWRGETKEVQTYVAVESRINNQLLPSTEYLSYLIDGATDHGFPPEYIEFLKSIPVCK
jgi:gamma-glutamylcyclotransferase